MNSASGKHKAVFFFTDISFTQLKKINHKDVAVYALASNKINSYLLEKPLKEKARAHGINIIIDDIKKEAKSDYLHIMCCVLFSVIQCEKTIYTSESIIKKSDAILFLNSLHPKRKQDIKFNFIPETKHD